MSKKSKQQLPEIGQRVQLRGRDAVGVLRKVDDRNWSWVDWEEGKQGPRIVHLFEITSCTPDLCDIARYSTQSPGLRFDPEKPPEPPSDR